MHKSRVQKVQEGQTTESTQTWRGNTKRIRGLLTTEQTRQLPCYKPYVQPPQNQYREVYTQPLLNQPAWEPHSRNISTASQFSSSRLATTPLQDRRGIGFKTPPDGRQSWNWRNNQLRYGNQVHDPAPMAKRRIPVPPKQWGKLQQQVWTSPCQSYVSFVGVGDTRRYAS